MANVAGKAYGMTALTPMTTSGTYGLIWTLFQRGVAEWAKPRVRQGGRIHRFLEKQTMAGANLRKLSFIHFARWALIRRHQWPQVGGSKPEELEYDYLLFESNFNGTWEQYIDAFSRVVPGGMDKIWRWSVKYPGSQPITPFLAYIRGCQIDTDYYYSAYPGATINDVVNAVEVEEALADLARVAADLPADEFLPEYERFLRRVGLHLGSTGPHPVPEAAPQADERVATPTSRLSAEVVAGPRDRLKHAAPGNGGSERTASGNGGSERGTKENGGSGRAASGNGGSEPAPSKETGPGGAS